ncbi:MAG: hypothetical protein HY340_02515 [Candidatus Kerfeldbacteria bacterium]|nr:hypothetical protein [Candidatus Kerfeldbacteria bacterium]
MERKRYQVTAEQHHTIDVYMIQIKQKLSRSSGSTLNPKEVMRALRKILKSVYPKPANYQLLPDSAADTTPPPRATARGMKRESPKRTPASLPETLALCDDALAFMDQYNAVMIPVLRRGEYDGKALLAMLWEEIFQKTGKSLAIATIHARVGTRRKRFQDGHLFWEALAIERMTKGERNRVRSFPPDYRGYRLRRRLVTTVLKREGLLGMTGNN